MSRKVLVIVVVAAIGILCLSGCKKRSSEAGAKTMAEYEAEARKEINKENMDEELEHIAKTLEQEISQEQ